MGSSGLQLGAQLEQRDEDEKRCGLERARHRPTGIPEIDRLLGGGIPLGALCEISGVSSSGRTSLALSLLAETTRSGELVGLVDAADAFDPISAEQAGVDLDRVLWVRARTVREALESSERLISTEGFPLVVFDSSFQPGRQPARDLAGRHRARKSRRGVHLDVIPTTAWLRLARLAAANRTALLVLSSERLAGSNAQIALSLRPALASFTGMPVLLEELETHAVLVRHRKLPVDAGDGSDDRNPDWNPDWSPDWSPDRKPDTPHESAA